MSSFVARDVKKTEGKFLNDIIENDLNVYKKNKKKMRNWLSE